jgi:hypothetical protein
MNVMNPMVEMSPEMPKGTLKNVQDVINTIIEICRLYGLPRTNIDLTKTTCHWLNMVEANNWNWIGVAKYKLAAFYSVHNNLTLPNQPFTGVDDDPKYLVGGSVRTWQRSFLRVSDTQTVESFLQSIKQTKKGMPRPSKKDLVKGIAKTLKKLTTAPEYIKPVLLTTWGDADLYHEDLELLVTEETVKKQLIRRVKELFTFKEKGKLHDHKLTYAARVRGYFPSTNSNYNKTRSEGGAVGEILKHPTLLTGLRIKGGYLNNNTIKSIIGRKEDEDEHQGEFYPEIKIKTDDYEEANRKLWHRLLVEAQKEEMEAEAVALAEPLKVRIITKMAPLAQTLMRSIQKHIHKILREHPAFRLLGQPQSEEVILGAMGCNLGELEYYLSGDYEAATDNLRGFVTETIWRQLSLHLGLIPAEIEIGLNLLMKNKFILTPKQMKETILNFLADQNLQLTGQLMGVIISFVILCIANGTACGWAMEIDRKRKSYLRDLPLLINGDDCLLKGSKELYHLWSKITAAFGLNESLGKTYLTRKFAEINSTSYSRVSQPKLITITDPKTEKQVVRETYLVETKYVNLGLAYGFKRSQGGAGMKESDARSNIGARARELIKYCPEKLQNQVMKLFLKHNQSDLQSIQIPYYIPEWLGGFGLPIGSWGGPSELDLRLAHKILLNWRKERPFPTNHSGMPWRIRQIAEQSLPEPIFNTKKGKSTELFDKIVGLKCIDLLFDSEIGLEDLINNSQENIPRMLIKNQKLWYPRGALPSPLTIEQLDFRARYPGYATELIQPIIESRQVQKQQQTMEQLD